jgi:hypothetical protein
MPYRERSNWKTIYIWERFDKITKITPSCVDELADRRLSGYFSMDALSDD